MRYLVFIISFVCLGFIGVPADAQDMGKLASFKRCGDIADEVKRLSCFDEALAALNKEEASRAEKEQEEFGLSQHQLEAREGRATKSKKVGEITARVVQQYRTLHGKFVLVLDNGQIWEETNSHNFRLPDDDGLVVEIKKGFLSGYRLKAKGHTGIASVRRVQ